MLIRHYDLWLNYNENKEKIKKLEIQENLFPGRKSIKEEKEKLIEETIYNAEMLINSNNEINNMVLNTILMNWFNKNCGIKTEEEIKKWVNENKILNEKIIKYISEKIGESMDNLCFLGGAHYCPKTKGENIECQKKLINEIAKSSIKYSSIIRDEENINLLLNGSINFVKKETKTQESNQSPIEQIMYEALLELAKKYNCELKQEYPVYDKGRNEIRYSLDLVFIYNNKPILDIECDGLTFHSDYNTMADDRQRDRWLFIRKIPVIRFTSREIFNDLKNCVIQTEYALKNAFILNGININNK